MTRQPATFPASHGVITSAGSNSADWAHFRVVPVRLGTMPKSCRATSLAGRVPARVQLQVIVRLWRVVQTAGTDGSVWVERAMAPPTMARRVHLAATPGGTSTWDGLTSREFRPNRFHVR